MPEELRRLTPGERIEGLPGRTWNAFVEAAQYVKGRKRSLYRDALRDVPQTGIVRLKNTSGADRERFDVLGIDDVFPEPAANLNAFKAGPALHGVTPSSDDHRARFAILLEPAKTDAIVAACVAGVCVAKVTVPEGGEDFGYAKIRDGDAGSLDAASFGSARILWKETGTGVKWAVIRIGTGAALEIWKFELAETLPQWSPSPVVAYRRFWDPEAHSGWGGYVTDCNVTFKVADWREVGYFGPPGSTGAAVIHQAKNGLVGVICDLRCPPECVCGYEASDGYSCPSY